MKKNVLAGANLEFSDISTAELLQSLHKRMLKNSVTIAVAESCTAGMLGAFLTRYEGSSSYFLGGLLTYSNEAKIKLLKINPDLLNKKGAVSSEVAKAMAEATRKKLGSDLAVSITGIAGPGGGSEDKPVGTVYVGIAGREDLSASHFYFKKAALSDMTSEDKRDEIRKLSCFSALELLSTELKKSFSSTS